MIPRSWEEAGSMEPNKPSSAYQELPLFLCLLGREAGVQSIWWSLGLLVNGPAARGDAAAGVKDTQTLTCSIPVSCGKPVCSSFLPMHRTESTQSGEFGTGILPGRAVSHQRPLSPPRPFLSYQRMYYVFLHMLSSGPAWLGITLLVTVSLLPDVLKKVLCRQLWPTATERTQVWRLPSLASHFPLPVL